MGEQQNQFQFICVFQNIFNFYGNFIKYVHDFGLFFFYGNNWKMKIRNVLVTNFVVLWKKQGKEDLIKITSKKHLKHTQSPDLLNVVHTYTTCFYKWTGSKFAFWLWVFRASIPPKKIPIIETLHAVIFLFLDFLIALS